MSSEQHWKMRAACRDLDPDTMFPRYAEQQHAAAQHCQACPVRTQCLAHALAHREEFGVWGGLTERQLRAVRRRIAA